VLLSVVCAPAALASGGPGPANGNNCQPVVGGQVGATTPVPISESATLSCPLASGPTGVPAGPAGPTKGPFQQGQSCWYVINQPVKIQVTSGGGVNELDPNATGTQYATLGYPHDLAIVPVTTAESDNIYMPYLFKGTADANGFCTVNVTSQLGCPNPDRFTNFVVVGNICWFTTPNPAVGGGLTPGQVTPFLDQASLLQFIHVGTMSSLPDNPNAGLVNIGTCFFVTGASFQGLGGAPQPISQPAFFTMSVSQPVNDGTGRFIFYIFRIEVAFTGVGWDFGDGSTVPDPSLPPSCQGVTADLAASHTYLKYGTFQVSITEHYDVTVQEFWEDANGPNGPITLTGLVPPITRVLGPYTKQVIQEEGVPVGA
jgi:hypothetical protein